VLLARRLRRRHALRRLRRDFAQRLHERERIARELHDTLLQSVQGLILGFRRVELLTPDTAPTRALMEETLAAAQQVLEEGRDMLGDLRGAPGRRADLIDVLRGYGERLARQHGIAFVLLPGGGARALPAAVHDQVQAIAREAIGNAFRHAAADRVEVECVYGRRDLALTVRDDGRGIPAATRGGRAGHWGIPGMRERAAGLGSTLELSTGAGRGTCWRLLVPARIAYAGAGDAR
jgi:signal transduction histidine kinase